jgi:cytochrome c5
MLPALLALATSIAPQAASGQAGERSGKQVVESVCVTCHGTGAQGAPKIGDRKAWGERASQGLTSLTQHALEGIRRMPPHGGNPELTDLEIARAIAYMVNQSGGRWIEPVSAKDMAVQRTGAQVVQLQCAKCHEAGTGGAPKIGDQEDWRPRLSKGLRYLVRSAIHGHGGMPPRGDKADLTDAEIRGAILYMFDPRKVAALKDAGPAQPAKPAGNVRSVAGLDIYLGFLPAEVLRSYPQGSVERTMHGGVPRGSGYYHVNVSVIDAASSTAVTGAKVDVRIEQPGGIASQTKTLEPVTIGAAPSYGHYVRLRDGTSYVVTVRVRKPEAPRTVEARFDHKLF